MNEEALTKIVVDLNTVAARLEAVASRIDRGAQSQQAAEAQPRGEAPITENQGKALWAISGAGKNFNLKDLIERKYGKSERHLSKREASDLIDGLKSGRINPKAPTAGAEAVAAAFPGAQDIGHPGQYGPGDDGRRF